MEYSCRSCTSCSLLYQMVSLTSERPTISAQRRPTTYRLCILIVQIVSHLLFLMYSVEKTSGTVNCCLAYSKTLQSKAKLPVFKSSSLYKNRKFCVFKKQYYSSVCFSLLKKPVKGLKLQLLIKGFTFLFATFASTT